MIMKRETGSCRVRPNSGSSSDVPVAGLGWPGSLQRWPPMVGMGLPVWRDTTLIVEEPDARLVLNSDELVTEELIKRVVEDFGSLVSISGETVDRADPTPPHRFEQYEFGFDHGHLTVSPASEDDTVRLTDTRMTLPHALRLTESAPWSAAIGSGVLWMWILQNHNGYRDGVQIEFGHSSEHLSVQLMCMASGVTAARILELDGQFLK